GRRPRGPGPSPRRIGEALSEPGRCGPYALADVGRHHGGRPGRIVDRSRAQGILGADLAGGGAEVSSKLGDILISQGVIDQDKLIAALSDQRAFGGKLGRTLIDLGYLTEDELLCALSAQLGLDLVDLDQTEVHTDALRCLPVDACERYGVFPVRVD